MIVIDSKEKDGNFVNLIGIAENQFFVEWGHENNLGNKEVTELLDIEKATKIFEERAKELSKTKK